MIKLSDYAPFNDHIESLQDLSYDTAEKEYLTTATHCAIAFDKAKSSYIRQYADPKSELSSVDALLQTNDAVVLVEFKNGDLSDGKRKKEVRLKVCDSLLMLSGIFNISLSEIRTQTDFILVYNEEKNPRSDPEKNRSRNAIHGHWMEKANTDEVRFSMNMLRSIYFREVHTFTTEQFEDYLSEQFPA